MGFVRKNTGIDLTGGGQRQAAKEAANIQSAAGREAMDVLRGDLAPFTQIGEEAASQLIGSMLQPVNVTAQDVMSDPFFQALSRQQEESLLRQRQAMGLGSSGGSQDVLSRSLLQLGEGFRQNRINEALTQQQARFNQLFSVAGLGQASAAQTGAQSSNILQNIGNVQSTVPLVGGQVAANQGQQLMQGLGAFAQNSEGGQSGQGGQGGLGSTASAIQGIMGLASMFSDKRLKTNIEKVGEDELGGIYEFEYTMPPHPDYEGRFRGRLAQELQQTRPDAVFEHDSGFLMVTKEFAPEAV